MDDWLDTVATLSTTGTFHPRLGALAGEGGTLHFHATDPGLDGEWLVRRTRDGVVWKHGHAKADVAVRGPVLSLLLVLNRRLGPEHLEVIGDASVFEHWLAHSQF